VLDVVHPEGKGKGKGSPLKECGNYWKLCISVWPFYFSEVLSS